MRSFVFVLLLLVVHSINAQLLNWSPGFIKEASSTVTITCDANKGNQGLLNYTPTNDVYVHIGVITSLSSGSSDWKYIVNSNFNAPATKVQAIAAGNNKWSFTINGGLRAFFNITNPTEKIAKIAVLFRNGNGTKVLRNSDASDMYIPVYDDGLYARFDTPFIQPLFKPIPQTIALSVGNTLTVSASASTTSTMKLLFNGIEIKSAAATNRISADLTITAKGTQTVIAEATNGINSTRDTLGFLVSGDINIADLPLGAKDGINYEKGDTSVVLVLFAPGKNKVSVIGDFNNWTENLGSQMNKTVDGQRFWLKIGGLTAGTEYAYQYIVDDAIKVADYNSEKILDPDNDRFIPSTTYPNLKPYPTGKATGIVSVFQTAKPEYNWQVPNFVKPSKNNLVIYELLLRDFVSAQNYQTLKDTLSYLKRLGVNAIELMPFSEFEGNLSWGYNPNFQFALDKFYGTENAFKQFIDECHKNGIAVIMDIVMNHCMGSSPLAQLYWDAANNRPAANSPWLNATAKHPFNVGNDFNHESAATKALTDRIIKHWLTNYKLDGFRWDLSKGFTQTNNPTDVAAWGNYDASRIAIWKRIYDTVQQSSAGSYCILEHFGGNAEEKELADYGMLLWGNHNYNFNQATMGYNTGSDFSGAISKSRGWNNPNLIAYQESHDEERMMYKNLTFGNVAGSYSIKDTLTALKRQEMAAAFWALIPGPKMIWQFGELGYQTSINGCPNGTVDAGGACRTDLKPIRWDYYNQPGRKALFDVYAKLIKLKLTPSFKSTFTSNNVFWNTTGNIKWLQIKDDSLQVVVVGNFDVNRASATITFPTAGTWYSYLNSSVKAATGLEEQVTLEPGEYFVYTNKNINNTVVTAINSVNGTANDIPLTIAPNPVSTMSLFSYQLPENATVKISLISLNGIISKVLFQGKLPAGKQQFYFDTKQLSTTQFSNGLYFLQLNFNKKIKTEKLLLMR
ncbi:MAG: alpha-amylase family glycosyl hydrolase [Sediminibacterium sp.]|nr:alpha-amylase family glycosyl hydrolase [Sediminibacterium sp.]